MSLVFKKALHLHSMYREIRPHLYQLIYLVAQELLVGRFSTPSWEDG